MTPCEEATETAHRREVPRTRPVAPPARHSGRKPGAQIGFGQRGQMPKRRLFAYMVGEERYEEGEVAGIGFDRQGGGAVFLLLVGQDLCD